MSNFSLFSVQNFSDSFILLLCLLNSYEHVKPVSLHTLNFNFSCSSLLLWDKDFSFGCQFHVFLLFALGLRHENGIVLLRWAVVVAVAVVVQVVSLFCLIFHSWLSKISFGVGVMSILENGDCLNLISNIFNWWRSGISSVFVKLKLKKMGMGMKLICFTIAPWSNVIWEMVNCFLVVWLRVHIYC